MCIRDRPIQAKRTLVHRLILVKRGSWKLLTVFNNEQGSRRFKSPPPSLPSPLLSFSHLISSHLLGYSLKTVVKRNCVQSSYTYAYISSPLPSSLLTLLSSLLPSILESKVQLRWQQFLLIFLRTDVIFCTKKQASYRTAGPIPRRAAPYEEFFSWGSRHHCPMEVCAYAIA